jgi:hypothetical protein
MCEQAKFAARHRTAEKDEAGRLVFGEIGVGMVVFHDAFEQTSGAGEAAALAADDGEVDPVICRGVEDVFAGSAIDAADALGCFENDTESPLLRHAMFDAKDYGL